MSELRHATIVEELAAARLAGAKLSDYPPGEMSGDDDAFAVQRRVSDRLGWRRRGWKIGCTSKTAMAALGTNSPFAGPVFAERLFGDGDHVPTAPQALRITEAEIAFTLGRDLPAREDGYGREEVMAAVDAVHAAIECVDRRAPGGIGDGNLWNIADGGLNDALVLGAPVGLKEAGDLAQISVCTSLSGKPAGEGRGANALGGPDIALVWLVNHLSRHGVDMSAGEVVTTGLLTPVVTAEPGDVVTARWSRLGELSLSY